MMHLYAPVLCMQRAMPADRARRDHRRQVSTKIISNRSIFYQLVHEFLAAGIMAFILLGDTVRIMNSFISSFHGRSAFRDWESASTTRSI